MLIVLTFRRNDQASHGDPRYQQVVSRAVRGRKGSGVGCGERPLGLVKASNQEEPPNLKVLRVCSVQAVAVLFEGGPRRVERFRRPA